MLPQLKKILIAIDFTENSAYAFLRAVNLAQRYNAKIIILHVIEPLPHMARTYTGPTVEAAFYKEKEIADVERIKKALDIFCKKIDAHIDGQCIDLVSEILVRVGHPMNEILEAADEKECDLIVVGSHGKGFLKRAFLGSVSQSVLTRTRKLVLVVPMPPESSLSKKIIDSISR